MIRGKREFVKPWGYPNEGKVHIVGEKRTAWRAPYNRYTICGIESGRKVEGPVTCKKCLAVAKSQGLMIEESSDQGGLK